MTQNDEPSRAPEAISLNMGHAAEAGEGIGEPSGDEDMDESSESTLHNDMAKPEYLSFINQLLSSQPYLANRAENIQIAEQNGFRFEQIDKFRAQNVPEHNVTLYQYEGTTLFIPKGMASTSGAGGTATKTVAPGTQSA